MTLTAVPLHSAPHGRVLVVDVVPERAHEAVELLLRQGFVCDMVGEIAEAADRLTSGEFDLVLADATGSREASLALLTHVVVHCPEVMIVVVTDESDPVEVGQAALAMGAAGATSRPLRPLELAAHLTAALKKRELERELRRLHMDQEQDARRRVAAFAGSPEDTIRRLVRITAQVAGQAERLERVAAYSGLIARSAGLSAYECELIGLAAPMYDVGLLALRGIDPEADSSRRHTTLGREILSGSSSPVLEVAAVIAWTHHEAFDGSGGPRRLARADIPVPGRVVAIADAYERLSATLRVPHRDTMQRLRAARGKQFDPRLLDAFFDVMEDVLAVRGAA